MEDPLAVNPRYRRAAYRSMWFAAVFAFLSATLACLSWAGLLGQKEDAPTLVLFASAGVVMFTFTRLIIRFLRV